VKLCYQSMKHLDRLNLVTFVGGPKYVQKKYLNHVYMFNRPY
jgi:hypothetical protein